MVQTKDMLLKAEHFVSVVLGRLLAWHHPLLKGEVLLQQCLYTCSTSFEVLAQCAFFAWKGLHLHTQHLVAWELFFHFKKFPWLASESALFAAFVAQCILLLHHHRMHFSSASHFVPAAQFLNSRVNSTTFNLKPAWLLLSCLAIVLIFQCSAAIH